MKIATLLGICMFLCFTIQGQATSSSKNFTSTIETTANVATAWKMLTNTSEWKAWDSEIVDTKYEGLFQEKSTGTLITSSGKIKEFKIASLENGKTYVLKYKVSSGILFVKRTVVATGTGSAITEEVWFKGISGKTFKKYYGDDYTTTIQTKLSALKQLMEG